MKRWENDEVIIKVLFITIEKPWRIND